MYFHLQYFIQSLDDTPPKNAWETTQRLQDGFISQYAAEYEFAARRPNFPPAEDIERAYAAAAVADDPGLFDETGEEVSEVDLENHYALAAYDSTNELITTVTCVDYQMPRNTRCRMPSGPYRVLTEDERDLIAA